MQIKMLKDGKATGKDESTRDDKEQESVSDKFGLEIV